MQILYGLLLIFIFSSSCWAELSLSGKVAIVTGASQGIGKAVAENFAKKGAKVILISRTQSMLEDVARRIQNTGAEADYYVADVTNEEAMHHMVDFALKKYGRLDIVCHNAGIYPGKKLDDMDASLWNHVINTNLTSTFYVIKACLPVMQKQKYGRIILMSSTSGPETGYPGQAHYTASKAGMIGFMKTAAIEIAKYGITMNAVAPGSILTEGIKKAPSEKLEKMKSVIPMKRLGLPHEVAHAVSFLASDESSFITGQYIVVDGGQVLPEVQIVPY